MKKEIKGRRKPTNQIQKKNPFSKMQIKKLSPKYPTMTLTWHSANCIICCSYFG